MTWIAKTTFIGAAALAWSAPALAKVSVEQGLMTSGLPILVTSQREVYSIGGLPSPARRLGRLPRRASPLVASGREAWAIETGERRAEDIRLYRIDPESQGMETIVPEASSLETPIPIDGIAGADAHYVYLLPDGRFDRERREIQNGHLDAEPDLQVLRVLVRGELTWYLARDRQPDSSGAVRLWLLHDSIWNEQGLRVLAGVEDGPVDLVSDDRNLFTVFQAGRVLRFDSASLRLLEDLSPMLRAESIRFFAADASAYWVGTRPAPDASADSASTSGDDEARGILWRIERDTLDGAPVHAESLPEGYAPFGATETALWFGSIDRPDVNPVMMIDKGDLTARAYGVRGMHARHWKAFGYGAANTGQTALIAIAAIPVIAVAVVTFPIWIWFVDYC